MLANLTILDSSASSQTATMVPEFRGCDRQRRLDEATDGKRPLCGGMAGRCLASGCPIAAMVKAARDARQAAAS